MKIINIDKKPALGSAESILRLVDFLDMLSNSDIVLNFRGSFLYKEKHPILRNDQFIGYLRKVINRK